MKLTLLMITIVVAEKLVIDPLNRHLFLPTTPLRNLPKLPPDPISVSVPMAAPTKDHLQTARIGMAASQTARRHAAQTARLPAHSYFTAMRTTYKHSAAATVDLIASMAASVGFPAPAIVYAVVVEEALLERVPYDCGRRILPRGGPLVVMCEAWFAGEGKEIGSVEAAGGWWVEVAVSEDGAEVWATAGAIGKACRRMHANFITGVSDSSESHAGCGPFVRYSPGF